MSVPTLQDFKRRFPELVRNANDEPSILVILDLVDTLLDEDLWDPKDWPKAFLYYAAHLVMLFNMQKSKLGSAGANSATDMSTFLSSVSFGERRISFAERTSTNILGRNDADIQGEELLDLTIYGQMYQLLRGRNIIPVVVI